MGQIKRIIRKIAYGSIGSLCCLGFIMIPIAGAHAQDISSVSVENNVAMGYVDITMNEYEYDREGRLVPCESYKDVLPGESVQRKILITNQANDAWIRLKLTFRNEQGLKGVGEEMLTGSNDGWIKIGDYYYRTSPLATGEGVYFDNSLAVPAQWDNRDAYKTFKMTVSVDAVQEKNFTPDFHSDDPWFGTVIEEAIKGEYEKKEISAGNFSVMYKGGAEGMVKVGDDFFQNWSELMPGDTWSDKAKIKSAYGDDVKIWFSTKTEAKNDLAARLILTIKNGEKTVFEGSLDKTSDKILLGTFGKGDERELSYTLYVPPELTNEYALSKAKTVWTFEAEIKGSETQEKNPVNRKQSSGVNTGDPHRVLPYLCLLGLAVLLALALYEKRKHIGRKGRGRR